MSTNALAFMPWANLSDAIDLGRVSITPWQIAKQLASKTDASAADDLLACFSDKQGKALEKQAVCVLDGQVCPPKIDQTMIDEIRDAVHALAFLTIAPKMVESIAANDMNDGPSNYDRFQIFPWGLPSKGIVVYKMGTIIDRWNLANLKIKMPLHVLATNDSVKKQFAKDMAKLFGLAANNEPDAVLIVRAMEWFALSQTNSPDVTFRSKLVMLSTAFEILLQFPDKTKAMYFAEEIDKLRSSKGNDVVGTRILERRQTTPFSEKANWAYDFYKLRNNIVHGQHVKPQDVHFTPNTACKFLNFDLLGCVLFNECVSRKMADLGCKNLLNHQKFEAAHKMIGWVA